MEFTAYCYGELMPEGALTSFTVCDAYFAGQAVIDVKQ